MIDDLGALSRVPFKTKDPKTSTMPQMYADAYKMALDACAFGNDPERALSYVHGMRLRSGLRPSAIHFEKAVIAMATAARFRDAYQLLAAAVEVLNCGFA